MVRIATHSSEDHEWTSGIPLLRPGCKCPLRPMELPHEWFECRPGDCWTASDFNTLEICTEVQRPPRGAGIPRSLRPPAKAAKVFEPEDLRRSISGSRLAARCSADERRTAAPRALSSDVGARPRKPPNTTPRALAEARAALVRELILRASSSAIAASMCNLKGSASGMSQATNRTSDFINVAMKATSRAKRSSFAMSRTAPSWRHLSIAALNSGRSALRPDSTSIKVAAIASPSRINRIVASCCASKPRPDLP
jgi:hypothetical protein